MCCRIFSVCVSKRPCVAYVVAFFDRLQMTKLRFAVFSQTQLTSESNLKTEKRSLTSFRRKLLRLPLQKIDCLTYLVNCVCVCVCGTKQGKKEVILAVSVSNKVSFFYTVVNIKR